MQEAAAEALIQQVRSHCSCRAFRPVCRLCLADRIGPPFEITLIDLRVELLNDAVLQAIKP